MRWIALMTGARVVVLAVLAVVVGAAHAERTFYWSAESDTPDVYPAGTDATPSYSYTAGLTSSEAHGGSSSLSLSGAAWAAATFDNPTNNDIWAPTEEGAITLWWKYTGQLSGSEMLFQITGKSRVSSLDTNDGISVRFHGDDELRLGAGWDADVWGTSYIRYRMSGGFEADRWYRITAKWNSGDGDNLFLQVDDLAPVTGGAIGVFGAEAWHQILWGNDRDTAPSGLFLDDMEIWNDYAMTPEPGSLTLLAMASMTLLRRRRG